MNAIGHLRRAVRRHAHLADAAIASAVFAATLMTAYGDRPADGSSQTAAVVAAALGCGALAGRRRFPLVALGLSASAAEVFLAESGSTSGVLILLAPLIALYTVADLVERRPGLFLGGGAVAALALVHAVHDPALLGPQNLAFIALGGLAIAAGDSARNRRGYLAEVEQRAERAEREREQDARRRIAEERLRIARDLHDAVGHQLAVISVQSSVAGQALDSDSASAREALAHVKAASRRALGELRDTVTLLRRPGEAVAPTAMPAPGLDGLDELLASLRASGLDIHRRVEGTVRPLAPAADLTAYRVIQESLTNVYKHSDGRQARLTLSYDRDELRITVDDLGGGRATDSHDLASAPVPAGRHGIVGMRERVLALGGHFTAGPRSNGAFQVSATLPHQPLDLAPENRP
ncbi:sensor histidine kinase [Streptomyces sp. HUAS TT20]|uniref:sensor histidine kinase n=1 Tax=Streptomyces sp. HUAS TT20 TaxID=3447509 RepID=UPI0021D95484|nr:sensor histidine kinase [Streptomyces sp. HUAS 15-9]UXY32110.1 sensor histidine kinase [Streptomyces sp. HUAS 15-9]